MYLSNFISSRYYNIKSSLSTEIAQNGELCPNSAQPTASRARAALCRAGNGNAAERGVDITAATQSLIESRAMRHEKNCRNLYIIVDTICVMTANAAIFTIVNKFPKNRKIFHYTENFPESEKIFRVRRKPLDRRDTLRYAEVKHLSMRSCITARERTM